MQLREFATFVFLTVFLVGIPLAAQESEFKPIFDGKSLAGWQGDEKLWRVEDGAIVGETTEENKIDGNQFLVWDQGEVDDFVLKASFRVSGTPAANSGIQFRSQKTEDRVAEWLSGRHRPIRAVHRHSLLRKNWTWNPVSKRPASHDSKPIGQGRRNGQMMRPNC